MRLNKKKLAALAMSAVMAASTMPFPVMAEELSAGEAVATEVESVGGEEAGDAYVVDSVTFSYADKKATATYVAHPTSDESAKESFTVDASVVANSEKAATCDTPGYIQLTVNIYGKDYFSGVEGAKDAIETAPATGHKYVVEVKRTVVKVPTHFEDGEANVWYKCSVCGKEEETSKKLTLDKQAHTLSTTPTYKSVKNIVVDEKDNVVLGEDGLPQAEDDTIEAVYSVTYKCTEDSYTESENVTIPAKTVAYAKITNVKGIKSNLNTLAEADADGKITNPTVVFPIAVEKIELTDCSKDGSYDVVYYTADGDVKSTLTITVPAHHYNETKVAVFKTEADMKQCTVEYKDGNLVVTNTSCYLPVSYEEVTLCTTTGTCSAKAIADKFEVPAKKGYVLNRETKEATPAGKHVIKQSAKDEINALVEKAGKDGKVSYSELEAIVKKDVNKDYVTVSARPACTKEGTVTVSYICMTDGKTVVETQDIAVKAEEHKPGTAKMDMATYVAPTCTSLGSYDAVVNCTVCNEELSRTVVKIPRLKHTNETKVTESGVGTQDEEDTLNAKNITFEFEGNTVVGDYKAKQTFTNSIGIYKDLNVKVQAVSTCDKCDHTVVLKKNVAIEVIDVQKQDASGHAGRITLKVSYKNAEKEFTEEKTFAFFSSLAAYLGRVDSEPEVVDGLRVDAEGCRYYTNNKFDPTFNGIAKYNGSDFFVANGVVASEADGLNLNEADGKWYFLSEGRILKNFTGTAMYDGQWFYITNGKLDTTINGLVPYNGGTFLFAEGRLRNDVNGLWQNFDDSWYFLALGQVQTQYTGVAEYDGAFFYVRSGKLATDFNGTVEYDGAKFKVTNGQLGAQVK